MPHIQHRFSPDPSNKNFLPLLYRFFFFDWLFADLSQAKSILEHHAARRHNQEMRKYLPTYLRRWGVVAASVFLAGTLCDRVLEAELAASCCYTGFSVTLGVMAVIAAAWVLMASPRFQK